MSLPDRTTKSDRTRIEQIWEQVRDMIRGDIADGTFATGRRLPSETVLAEQNGVARMTARKAVQQLAAEGLLTVIHGRGTFVTGTP
jgi:DNA-binding GntR family transcriptional regulator